MGWPKYFPVTVYLALLSLRHLRSRILHGFDDLLISCAPADVAVNSFTDFFLRGVGIFFQEGNQGHQEAGSAEAALQGVFLCKGLLQRMQIFRSSQGFHGADLVPVMPGQQISGRNGQLHHRKEWCRRRRYHVRNPHGFPSSQVRGGGSRSRACGLPLPVHRSLPLTVNRNREEFGHVNLLFWRDRWIL